MIFNFKQLATVVLMTFIFSSVIAQDQPLDREQRLQAHENRVKGIIEQRRVDRQLISDLLKSDVPGIGSELNAEDAELVERQITSTESALNYNENFQAYLKFKNTNLEILHTFGKGQEPGNITVSPDNRIFMSVHQFYGSEKKVVEVLEDGWTVPYPNEDWNRAFEDAGHKTLHGVLGLRCDREGILWLLDRSPGPEESGKLVGWDTNKEKLHRVIMLRRPVIGEEPFLNDLAVDREHEAIYITDTAAGHDSALIIVDLTTGQTRRVLEGSPFTTPEDIDMVIDGRTIMLGGEPARIGVNPITIDPTNQWVYFGPMTGTTLYRVRTLDLLNADLEEEELRSRVEAFGNKPICDGITIDSVGNIYISSVTENAISVLSPYLDQSIDNIINRTNTPGDLESKIIFQDDRISWPDAFTVTPDGNILAIANQLHRSPPLSEKGEYSSTGEYYILKFKSPYPAVHGR